MPDIYFTHGQEDHRFEVNLGYTLRLYLKNKKTNKTTNDKKPKQQKLKAQYSINVIYHIHQANEEK